MNNYVRRALRKIAKRRAYYRIDPLAEREKVAQVIRERAVDGQVTVAIWSRDCDLAESLTARRIPANPMAYERLFLQQADGAEGPFSLAVLTPEEAEEFQPSFRDRALEAFENGHPHVIYA